MKRLLFCLWLMVMLAAVAAAEDARTITAFDDDWRFANAGPEVASAREQPQSDDSAWRKLDLPHDWSIEGPFSSTNQTGCAGAFLPAGIGWYRKHFTLPDQPAQRRVFVAFDGVMANSDVWINGFHLGHRPTGYLRFEYELTGHLNFGGRENVLAVEADNSLQPASRWYAGAGIYRHVQHFAGFERERICAKASGSNT